MQHTFASRYNQLKQIASYQGKKAFKRFSNLPKGWRIASFIAISIGFLSARDPYFLTKLAQPAVDMVKGNTAEASFVPKGPTPYMHTRTEIIEHAITTTKFDTTDKVAYARLRIALTNAFDSIMGTYTLNQQIAKSEKARLAAYIAAARKFNVEMEKGFLEYPWAQPAKEPVVTGINRKKGAKLSGKSGGNDWGMEGREALAKDYIEKYHKIAIAEMEKFGIPASIALAQGLVESGAGSSRLAKQANNHFGMKCFLKRCRKGHCMNATDDSHKDFFRKYNSAWESWRAHSQLLAGGHYSRLKKYGKDYQQWAYGLKALGYATDRTYAEKLIGMIEKYDLDRFDQ